MFINERLLAAPSIEVKDHTSANGPLPAKRACESWIPVFGHYEMSIAQSVVLSTCSQEALGSIPHRGHGVNMK